MKTKLTRDPSVTLHVWVDDRPVVDASWHVYTSADSAAAYAVAVHPDTNSTVKVRIDKAPSQQSLDPPQTPARQRPRTDESTSVEQQQG